jgi:long-chain fatty acid transport protein
MKEILRLVAAAVYFMLFAVSSVYGAGFSVNTQGATPLGQGNAVIAHTNDPSSVFFNPALINNLPGTQLEAGTSLLIPSNEFVSSFSGKSFETERDVFLPSVFYATHHLSDRFSIGFGFFSNFGLANKWPDDWEGRYIATKSELKTYTLNPVISYRLTPNITVAAGVPLVFLNAELNKMVNLSSLGLPDVRQTLKGDAFSAGFNAGLLIDVTKDISVGLAYRSIIRMGMTGDITYGFPSGTPAVVTSLFPDTGAHTTLKLPAMANFGVAYKGLPRTTIEVGGRWEGWSSYQELRIVTDKRIAGFQEITYPRNWKDIYSLNMGARYQVNDAVAVMLGYIYEGNPVPDDTLDPIVPTGTSQVYCIGTDIRFSRFLLGISYAYQKVEDRNKNNAIDDNQFDGIVNPATSANGVYKADLHMVGISITYRF